MRICFFFLLIVIAFQSYAQVKVDVSRDIVSIVKQLEGKGVRISNISSSISTNAAGYFYDEISTIGLESGLILTTGNAQYAEGPNDHPHKTLVQGNPTQDPDLLTLVDTAAEGKMADVCIVEFDIETVYPSLEFNFVFASEEYLETLEYHDVVGFFISGPGISGKKNLALIPGTTVPVSVGTINPNTEYSSYYRGNGTGSTPYINPDFQYDGYTIPLKAFSKVIPCEKYHIKLAIADMLDDTYDAAIFIQQGGFISNSLDMDVSYEYSRFNTALEGCNNAIVKFTRNTTDIKDSITYQLQFKGTALPGIDYLLVPDSVVFAPEQTSQTMVLEFVADAITDDQEFVRILVKSSCDAFNQTDSIDIPVRENFDYNMPDVSICRNQLAMLNPAPILTDSIFWNTSPYLSCLECLSPVATLPDAQLRYFLFSARDTISRCESKDSVAVITVIPVASFNFYTKPCYTSLDYFFENTSTSYSKSIWDFNDNNSSEEQHPHHQFPGINSLNSNQYNVTLTVKSEIPSCEDDTTILVSITEPFFIPNLLTANHDGKNDKLAIKGIQTGCWQLDIYNEWGSLMFTEKEYQNNFDGTELSGGIYYFLLSNHPDDRQYKGWVQLIK